MFQSLLFWIIGSGVAYNSTFPFEELVSILVVLDHWFGRREENCSVVWSEMFQSLLFWIIGSGLPEIATDPFAKSFNPCCFGSLVRARLSLKIQELLNRFQSLLFWIIGSGYMLLSFARKHLNVSILVVLDHWFGPAHARFGHGI